MFFGETVLSRLWCSVVSSNRKICLHKKSFEVGLAVSKRVVTMTESLCLMPRVKEISECSVR